MYLKNQRKTVPFVFRRWDNKRYAVFNSLKKSIVIGCLVLSYFVHINPQAAIAQSDTSSVAREYDLESIDVTSDALPETYSSISRVVVTISKAEIERAAVSSLNELLEYASNIDIRQRGVNGIQADISLRGGSFDQVLILLNGVNITDPQTGHHNLNIPIDLSSIQQIEILKGPGAWKFGPGAFSGAINIITSVTENSFVGAAIEAGQFLYHDERITAGYSNDNTSHFLAIHHSSSDGYIQNTDYKLKDIYYRGILNLNDHELSIQAGAASKGFGATNFYTARYPDQYEEIQTYFASASMNLKFKKIQIDPKVYFRRNNDWFTLFRSTPEWYSNYHTSDVWGTNLLASYYHDIRGITSFGVDTRTETIYSNNLGEESNNPIMSPVNDTIALNRYHSRTTLSAFVGHKHYFNRLTINVGANLSINTDLDNKLFFYPGLDLNYQLTENSSFYGSLNKTMRMPTYTDLYYHGPNNEGNPGLLPEEAMGYELGYKYSRNAIDFSLTGFFIKGDNIIDWVRETINDKWITMNYTSLNTVGFEGYTKFNLKELFESQDVMNELKVAYTTMNQYKIETDLISNYSLNYLKDRVDIDLNHNIYKGIKANWHFAFQDRNGQFEEIVDAEVLNEDGTTSFTKVSNGMVDYQPFTTCDMKIYWKKNGWNVNAGISNLFNTLFYDFGNVPQPGRWIKFGIAKKIEF